MTQALPGLRSPSEYHVTLPDAVLGSVGRRAAGASAVHASGGSNERANLRLVGAGCNECLDTSFEIRGGCIVDWWWGAEGFRTRDGRDQDQTDDGERRRHPSRD